MYVFGLPLNKKTVTMPLMSDELANDEIDEKELEQYAARTRQSLIARLDNWDDQKTWDEFYKTYWKLIYSVALKARLRQDEAWDVVQETIFTIAKQSKKNMYNPSQGSFKSWLWNMTRWRINDQFRKRKKDTALVQNNYSPDIPMEDWLEKVADEKSEDFEQIWETEWQKNILYAALSRVKEKVSPQHYQIFDYYVLREWDASKVARHLGVPMTQVYLAKHRVGAILKKEMSILVNQSRD